MGKLNGQNDDCRRHYKGFEQFDEMIAKQQLPFLFCVWGKEKLDYFVCKGKIDGKGASGIQR